jgi:hypothetical protein
LAEIVEERRVEAEAKEKRKEEKQVAKLTAAEGGGDPQATAGLDDYYQTGSHTTRCI